MRRREPRLDGDDEAGIQPHAPACSALVGHRRRLVRGVGETLRRIEGGRIPTPAFFTIVAVAFALDVSLDRIACDLQRFEQPLPPYYPPEVQRRPRPLHGHLAFRSCQLGGTQADALGDDLTRLGYTDLIVLDDENGDVRGIEATRAEQP